MSDYNPVWVKDGKLRVNFSLFKNDRREKDSHPQAKSWDKGTGISVSAWTKNTQAGDRYQSCVIEIPLEVLDQYIQPSKPAAAPAPAEDFDDDLPF